MAEPNRLDQFAYAWKVLQLRVNTSLPSWTARVKAARSKVAGVARTPPPTYRGGDSEQ